MNLQTVVTDNPVWSEVLAFEMHVDRHVILGASSTNWRDEVDCNDPALLLNELGSIVGDEQFHDYLNPLRLLSLSQLAGPLGLIFGDRHQTEDVSNDTHTFYGDGDRAVGFNPFW